MFLYKISFPEHLTTKCYIGITKQTLKQRFKSHCRNTSKSLVSKAIRKYGIENACMSIIAEYDDWDSLCLAEKEAIKCFNTKNPQGYNLTDGGEGLNGHVFSETHKANLSKSLKGKTYTEETLKRMSESAKNKIITPEHRQKLLKRKKGSDNPRYGSTRSQEVKDKISKSLTGLKASAETKLKQSIAHSNPSIETRKKQSAANRNRKIKSATGFKGVCYIKKDNKYRARCVYMGKENTLGYFKTPEEASEAYQKFIANLPA